MFEHTAVTDNVDNLGSNDELIEITVIHEALSSQSRTQHDFIKHIPATTFSILFAVKDVFALKCRLKMHAPK